MKSFELSESEIQKMSNEELMEMQLKESIDSINESFEKTNKRFKHFIGLLCVSIAFSITFSFYFSCFLFFIDFIILVSIYKSNEKTKTKLMSHKMLVLFFKERNIVNNNNSYILEKYSIKKYKKA